MTGTVKRSLTIFGITALMAGAVAAAPRSAEAAPYRREVYRNGHWYTLRGQRLQYRNGYWFDARGQRRWDLDRDGIPNYRDRDRDGDGVRNGRDRHPDNYWRGGRDMDRDGIRNSR
ncbi:MAG TPA: hypothetical protein VFU47_06930, partial [Armatimonadota bacterium]|nr:hypothetical protein [Armatimonadota bacterium]